MSAFRKITKKSVEDDYEHNLWMATEDIWVEMYAGHEMDFESISDHIHSMIDSYMDYLRQWAVKDFHGMSADKRRKFR